MAEIGQFSWSYTGGIECEFPDAYVEAYPEFFGKIHDYAAHALGLFEELELEPDPSVTRHLERLSAATDILRQMAEHLQRHRFSV